MGSTAAMIRDGLSRLKANGVDVIVVDPQYAPAIVKRGADTMVDMIALTTRKARVDLFDRFAVMRHWRLTDNMPCILVSIGATPEGKKELIGFTDGMRESAQSWRIRGRRHASA